MRVTRERRFGRRHLDASVFVGYAGGPMEDFQLRFVHDSVGGGDQHSKVKKPEKSPEVVGCHVGFGRCGKSHLLPPSERQVQNLRMGCHRVAQAFD